MFRWVTLASALIISATAAAPRAQAEPLYGVSVLRQMLITVDQNDAHVTDVGSLGTYIQNVAHNSSDGYVYGYDFQDDQRLRRIDPADGSSVAVGAPITDYGWASMHGMAYIPDQGVLYATAGYSRDLLRIDPGSGVPSHVGTMPAGVWALAYDNAADVLYGVTTPIPGVPADHDLVRIDMSDASFQVVAPLGQVEGLTYDPTTGDLLAAMISSPFTGTDLVRVNPQTGATTPIGFIGPEDWISGLAYVPEPASLLPASLLLITAARWCRSGGRRTSVHFR